MAKNNGQQNQPFGAPGVPIVGQPFTLHTIAVPITATLTCNCGGPDADTSVVVTGSVPAACRSCQKTYNLAFNPTTLKVEMAVIAPKAEVPQ